MGSLAHVNRSRTLLIVFFIDAYSLVNNACLVVLFENLLVRACVSDVVRETRLRSVLCLAVASG